MPLTGTPFVIPSIRDHKGYGPHPYPCNKLYYGTSSGLYNSVVYVFPAVAEWRQYSNDSFMPLYAGAGNSSGFFAPKSNFILLQSTVLNK